MRPQLMLNIILDLFSLACKQDSFMLFFFVSKHILLPLTPLSGRGGYKEKHEIHFILH